MRTAVRTIDERVAQLEVKVETYRTDIAELKGAIAALDEKMDGRFEAMDGRFMSVIRFQFATLLAILAAAFGVITQLL